MRYHHRKRDRRLPRRSLITSVVVTLLAAVGLAVSASALSASQAGVRPTGIAAQPPAGPVTGLAAGQAGLYAVQARLDSAAARIQAAGAGNASVVVVPSSGELRVYWHGQVPARVRALAGRLGVRVRFASAAFTLDALVAQERQLVGYPGLVQVAPRSDGSGLNVVLAPAAPARAQARLRLASRIPLTITTGASPQAAFTRQADFTPYWGGSLYNNIPARTSCSNGFALNKAPTVYEISAGHCGAIGNTVNIPNPLNPNPTGVFVAQNVCRDIAQINYRAGGTVAGFIFNGGPNSGNGVPVAGAVSDNVGDIVATGGAASGEHLNEVVVAVNLFAAVAGIPCAMVGPLTEAVSVGNCVVAAGDSGGPAYSYTDSTNTAVNGRGTIVAMLGTAVMCPGAAGPIPGFDTVEYAPLLRPPGDPQIGSLQFWGTTLLTGVSASPPPSSPPPSTPPPPPSTSPPPSMSPQP